MNILYYCWNENNEQDIEETFAATGNTFTKIKYPLSNYDVDSSFTDAMEPVLREGHFDLLFTFNYFPILSTLAQQHGLHYACWVYDCPHLTLYSRTVTNSCNYFFLFDRTMVQTLQSLGACHVYHLPLAVNTFRLERLFADSTRSTDFPDVSFVGSLYEKNMYDQIHYLPDYIRGYLTAIMNAQKKVWGCNFIGKLLAENPSLVREISTYIQLGQDSNYLFTNQTVYANMLNQKITSDERISYLELAGRHADVTLYSASDAKLCPSCHHGGIVSYSEEMPKVFHNSKINLNLTLRSITSGIPLRCMDIMGAGGFLLTNFQPELVEFFEPDVDFVYYEDEIDLLAKIDYYLSHDKERQKIASSGAQKVAAQFSYPHQFQTLLDTIYPSSSTFTTCSSLTR